MTLPTARRCGVAVVQTPVLLTAVTSMSHDGDAAVPTSLPSSTSLLAAFATSPFAVTRMICAVFRPLIVDGSTSYVYDR